ncbi:hypothetical protein [Nocardia uniformis]|nr:hypothetical protein [Nocardia uniformis]
MLDRDEIADIEIHVIQDVIDIVENRLQQHEHCGWRLTVPRSHLYATVLYAVIAGARQQSFRATLDSADILDSILDGAEPCVSTDASHQPIDVAITRHAVHVN